ncbi:NB-ARC domain-containing protein [Micromonospora sp. CPCC 205539]|uniref:NB-ARC domain-containing protein n=1 Tax=Micromonospora sp. CPCC 205539 TaxID=3122408 RepID=UPI002FF04105
MSEIAEPAGGDRFEAHDHAHQFNAPDGTINVFRDSRLSRVVSRPWMAPPQTAGLVARPELADPLLDLVTGDADGPIAVAGVHGTGGFGKTTLAAWVCHQRRVRDRFPGGLLWITVGEHSGGADLAGRVNNLIEHLTGARSGFTDPVQAGHRLGTLLDSQPDPVLLVVDDVWRADQLDPFRQGGARCRRLITTRRRGLVPARSSVWVDRMSAMQAAALLTRDLEDPPAGLVARILSATGRWPVLLSIANQTVVRHVEDYGSSAAWALRDFADRLIEEGPAGFDFDDAARSGRAVEATIRAGVDLLDPAIGDRFTELAIFGEDVDIPLSVLNLLWARTGGLTPRGTRRVCTILASMSLLLRYEAETGTIRLHDIVRAYLLRNATDAGQRTRLHNLLVDAAAPLTTPTASITTAWWTLPATEDYLVARLAEHLHAAGRHDELAATVTDLRWVTARLQRHGPAGVEADLSHVNTTTAKVLLRAIRQNSHLLTPTEPPDALGNVLVSRLHNETDLAPLLATYVPTLPRPRLANRWPPPDLPHPALQRILIGHAGPVRALVVAPDGTWLASASDDGTARIWDPVTGNVRHTLTGHAGMVTTLVVAPDGTWLGSTSGDGTVRIWDPTTGDVRHTLTGRDSRIIALVVAPDGLWLASTSDFGPVQIWDPRTGTARHTLTAHTSWITALLAAPDGSWLASASDDGTVRIWDPTTGNVRHTLTAHTGGVTALAVAPDGTWLASTSNDKTVRIWDPTTGNVRHTLTAHTRGVTALAVAPDGTWLASTSNDKTVRIWDPTTGNLQHTLTAHTGGVTALAVAPDGTWLASASAQTSSDDRTVRIWDPRTGSLQHILTGHASWVRALVAAPDGTWLASASSDGTVRIWNATNGNLQHTPGGHSSRARVLVVAPDGTWLASASHDGTVRIWNATNGNLQHTLTGQTMGAIALVVAPDGSWLASVSGDDQSVRIWDPSTGNLHHNSEVTALTAAPDGTWLASTSNDNTVRISDPSTGNLQHTFAGHDSKVKALAVAPNGTWLVSTSTDGTIYICDTQNGEHLTTVRIDALPEPIAVGPDSRTVYCAGAQAVYGFDLLVNAD